MANGYAEVWLPHRVSYGETDAMQVVYHAEYIHYFERSRGEICRACGLPYSEIEKAGCMLPVREVQCRYRSAARFGYEIWDEERKPLLCTGMSLHAFTDREVRPVPIPAWVKERFLAAPAATAE